MHTARLTVILVFLALGMASGAYAFDPTRDISAPVEKGIIHFARGDVDGAISEFSAAIRINPKDYLAYYHRAKAYEYQEQPRNAVDDYGMVVGAGPQYFLFGYACYYRGLLCLQLRRFDEALIDYNLIIDQPGLPKTIRAHAYNNRGLVLDWQGNYDSAVSDFNRTLELIPDILNTHYNRGVSYANQGAYQLAREDFLTELERLPRCTNAHHYNLAIQYYTNGDYYRSWYEVFRLMRCGQHVSRLLITDLKNKLEKAGPKQVSSAVLRSIGQ